MTNVSKMSSLDAALPPPKQDRDVAGEMSKLGGAIKNHAQNYYLTNSEIPSSLEAQIRQILGAGGPYDPRTIVVALSTSGNTIAAVRFVLAWSIYQNITTDAASNETLLPPVLVDALSATSKDPGKLAECRILVRLLILRLIAMSSLTSKWRQISAALTQKTFGGHDLASNDPRQANVRALVQALDGAIGPFANTTNNRERLQNLEEVVRRGARFGFMLFSQPSTYDFEWDSKQANADNMVVLPALLQTTDDRGHRHERAVGFTDAQVATLS